MANKVSGYLQDVSKEMKKVHWPSRNELISNTVLTLIAALVLALFIYVADQGISGILERIYLMS
jgi:preprotein translocase subunit SecE